VGIIKFSVNEKNKLWIPVVETIDTEHLCFSHNALL